MCGVRRAPLEHDSHLKDSWGQQGLAALQETSRPFHCSVRRLSWPKGPSLCRVSGCHLATHSVVCSWQCGPLGACW